MLGMPPSVALRLASELLASNMLGVSGLEGHRTEHVAFAEADGPPTASGRLSRVSGALPVSGASGSMSAANQRSPRPPHTER